MRKDKHARLERDERERWIQRTLRELRRLVRQLPRYRQRSLLDALDDAPAAPPPRTDTRLH